MDGRDGFYSQQRPSALSKYHFRIILGLLAGVLLLFAWHFLSDGDFSFLMVRVLSVLVALPVL
jgi:hypothetical protein